MIYYKRQDGEGSPNGSQMKRLPVTKTCAHAQHIPPPPLRTHSARIIIRACTCHVRIGAEGRDRWRWRGTAGACCARGVIATTYVALVANVKFARCGARLPRVNRTRREAAVHAHVRVHHILCIVKQLHSVTTRVLVIQNVMKWRAFTIIWTNGRTVMGLRTR